MGWDDNAIDATLLGQDCQVMHFHVKLVQDKRELSVSFIYGDNDPRIRTELWDNLRNHMDDIKNLPWVLLGNFNVTLYADENTSGVSSNDHGITEFRDCVSHLDMEDIAMNGLFFTWIQKMKNLEKDILNKLVRVMGNSSFFDEYGSSYACFLPYVTSDHCPALLVIPEVTTKKKRAFRFMNYLADKKMFHQVVKDKWDIPVDGYAMFVLVRRLNKMKKHLRKLNLKNSNVFEKVQKLRTELKRVQTELDSDPMNAKLREEEMVYTSAYKEAVLDEEKVLKQKSKIEWLKEGDHNSSLFHNSLKGRFSRSKITMVKDEFGRVFKDEEVVEQFVTHFQPFLGTRDQVFPIEEADEFFTKKIDGYAALHMIRHVSDEEIRIAIFCH